MNYDQMGKKSDFNVLVQKLKIQLLEGRADARALKILAVEIPIYYLVKILSQTGIYY